MKKFMVIFLAGSLLLSGCGSAYVDNNNENISDEKVHEVEAVTDNEISETPVIEISAEETPATKAPATKTPATKTPATKTPATKAPATKTPATKAPATKTPATETPSTEVPLTEESKPTTVSGPLYEVIINGYGISINTDIALLVDKLGTPDNFQSAASCLGAGLDKIYTYNGITLYTQPEGAKDIIYLIEIDVGGKLGCGIGVGSPLNSVINVFGANYTQSANYVSYIINGIEVDFEITNNAVSYIEIFKN